MMLAFSSVLSLCLFVLCAGFIVPFHSTTNNKNIHGVPTTTTTQQQRLLWATTTSDDDDDVPPPFEEWESAMSPKEADFSKVHVNDEPIYFHHAAIKTRNIENSIHFYGLLGFQVIRKFILPGSVRAVWMQQKYNTTSVGNDNDIKRQDYKRQHLELIEIPQWRLEELPGKKRQSIDFFNPKFINLLGYHHVALDVTESLKAKNLTSLCDWVDDLNRTSIELYGKHLRPALECQQVMIVPGIYDVAMIRDPDGCLVEFVNHCRDVDHDMLPDW